MDMKHILLIIAVLLAFAAPAVAQEAAGGDENTVVVTGVVTDEENLPMIGVNIVVKDMPGMGVITDMDGRYRIKMEPYHRLRFTYLGYEAVEVLIKEQREVNIKMKEDVENVLDEVVITATGAQKKINLSGAITTIAPEELQTAPSGNLVNALGGTVAGIITQQTTGQPGQNTSEFWIRGISTFGASTSALVLVDGFERDIDDVNIEDIESFSVLKDASATAIYGSRGANGVVLITTKHGGIGKTNIDVKVETSYNTRTITPEFADGYTYANMMNEARITRNQAPIYSDTELYILKNGLDPDLYPNVDWMDMLLKDGAMTYRANVNMNGGGSTARYFVSVSYLKEGGMYNTDETLRNDYNTNCDANSWNYRLNTDINVTKTTVLKVGVSGTLKKYNEPGLSGDVWGSLMRQNPISIPVMYSNGYVPAYGTGGQTNPWVLATQTGYKEHWENTIQTNITLEQDLSFITKGLRFVGRFGFDTWNKNNIDRIKWPEQWKAERQRDANGNLVFERISTEQLMKQSSSAEGNRYEVFEAELHYDRGFGKHHLGGLLKLNQDAKTFTVNVGEDIKNGIARRHFGLAGRVSYNWNLRYYFDFNFGYNGSENFADGHRFGFFPAFSAAWNVSEEPIIKKNLPWLSMFKIRYSYGKVGNDALYINGAETRFPYLYTIGSGNSYQWADFNFSSPNNSGLRYTDLASTAATWEIATKHDLGLDIALFNDRFTATVDYFHEQRDGIWVERAYLPALVGLQSNPRANVGSVLSEGFDGNFAYKQKIGQVDFVLRGNFTYSKNTTLERDEENNVYPYLMQEGYRVDQARGLIALGLFKDYDDIRNSPTQQFGTVQPGDIKYKDVNGDGVVDDNDQVPIGSTTRPNMIYGFGISAAWKGLDVNVHFQGTGKSSFFVNGETVYAFSAGDWGNVLKSVAESDRWISADISGDPATENPNASYPRLSYGGNSNNYRNSTFWLRDGSYLRLKTLEVGYTLPKSVVNSIRLNNVRVFFRGNNLLTFSKFDWWDPELGSSNGQQYPLARTFTLGLTVNL